MTCQENEVITNEWIAPRKIPGLTPTNRPFPVWPETQPHSAQVGTVLVPYSRAPAPARARLGHWMGSGDGP